MQPRTLFTDSLLDGSAAELVRKARAEGQQFSNTDLGTPEKKKSRDAFPILISFLDAGIWGLFFVLGIMILEQICQNADC